MFPVMLGTEHLESLRMVLEAAKAERAVVERWGHVTVRQALAIDDVEEIIDRIETAARENKKPALAVMRGRRPW